MFALSAPPRRRRRVCAERPAERRVISTGTRPAMRACMRLEHCRNGSDMADTVAEIMDPHFFCASQTESIGQLLHDMAELGLGSAPVLDLQGHPLGMATLRDIDGCRRPDELPE